MGMAKTLLTVRWPYGTMSYKVSVLATDLLMVPVLYSILVRHIKLIHGEVNKSALGPRPVMVRKIQG